MFFRAFLRTVLSQRVVYARIQRRMQTQRQ
jgi:hypothetical protein